MGRLGENIPGSGWEGSILANLCGDSIETGVWFRTIFASHGISSMLRLNRPSPDTKHTAGNTCQGLEKPHLSG